METRKSFSSRIAVLRSEKGLTQGALAEALGISRQSVTQYENGIRIPDREVFRKFTEYFGVTADYLLGISDNRTNETAGIGDKLGLSDEAIAALMEYAEKANSPEKPSGMSLSSILGSWEKYKYMDALKVLNRILPDLSLLIALGNYLFDKRNDYTAAHEIVYTTDDMGTMLPGQEILAEQEEINQAINMYRIQKELMRLQKTIEQEETNAQED